MKRIRQFHDLSNDHHSALVLALKAKRIATGTCGDELAAVWQEVEFRFHSEINPHFITEEACLIDPMRSHGYGDLVDHMLDDHKVMRNLVDRQSPRTTENLRHFGEVLQGHVRFEEQELFEQAQNCFTEAELKAVVEACNREVAEEVCSL